MKVVFLHGVGDGDPDGGWLAGLNRGMADVEGPGLNQDDVIAPQYSEILSTDDVVDTNPSITYRVKNDDDARRAFETRQARIQRMLRDQESLRAFGFGIVPDPLVHRLQTVGINSVDEKRLMQVRRYMTNEGLRGAVLRDILGKLPRTGDIVLIGHSLGSVIAIDLLDHLPEQLHVRRFITIGSPAGSPALHENSERLLKKFPYGRVDDWSNFLDSGDPITAGRGLAAIFAGAQDFEIDTGRSHDAAKYLAHPAVASLVADILTPSKDLVPASHAIVPELTDAELGTLLTLTYGTRVVRCIKNDAAAQRYEDALGVLQDSFADEVRQRALGGQGLPPELETLISGRLPNLPRRWELQDAVPQLVVLAFTNIVQPYEIAIGNARVAALGDVCVDMGFRSGVGTKIAEAVWEVEAWLGIGERKLFTRKRVLTAAAGLALLAAGPIGLMAAGSATAVGAAAITSSLAAFGPGGMIGGIAMVGGLASTGAMVTTAAATIGRGGPQVLLDDPTVITIRVASAYALRNLDQPHDPELWHSLCLAETQIAGEINRMLAFSDEKSAKLKRLESVADIIAMLMQFMLANGLTPPAIAAAVEHG